MAYSDGSAERRKREAEFHDKWASDIDPTTTLVDETFNSITAVENQHILGQFGDVRGKRVLDYGCGAAEGGIYLAKLGAKVTGIDVSPGMLEAAKRLAAYHEVEIETRVVEGDTIPADDREFDLVYGNGVLHHVDLSMARRELARVMSPQGVGCFLEPLGYNPAIDVYRRMAHAVRTDDERPLTLADITAFEEWFERVSHQEFWFLTLGVFLKFFLVDRVHPRRERYWKKIYTNVERFEWLYRPLKRGDDILLKRVPALRRLCWTSVITIERPKQGRLR
jgi:SAM-dependent methyltransferase